MIYLYIYLSITLLALIGIGMYYGYRGEASLGNEDFIRAIIYAIMWPAAILMGVGILLLLYIPYCVLVWPWTKLGTYLRGKRVS